MSETRKPPAPTGLGSRGRRFWRDITGKFDLERDEHELLLEICRQLDTVEAMSTVLAVEGVTSAGSRGQVRVHPLVPALNAARGLLSRQLAQLGLPDQDDAAMATPTQTRARRAAEVRWRNHTPRDRRSA